MLCITVTCQVPSARVTTHDINPFRIPRSFPSEVTLPVCVQRMSIEATSGRRNRTVTSSILRTAFLNDGFPLLVSTSNRGR